MTPVLPSAEGLPDDLLSRPQWLCWKEQDRDGKPTKVPIDPASGSYASATDPSTWADFEVAHEHAENSDAAGLGFVFTDDDSFVGVDLDDCRVPETGTTLDWAEDIVDLLDSYTEVSPSGTGYHIIVRGELPGDRNRKGSVELYETARFFTVTGDHVDGTPTDIRERQGELQAVYAEHVSPKPESSSKGSERLVPTGGVDLEDEQLLSKARNAKNGEKFSRLWGGSTSGYESQSEADMALCSLLAFWTGGDAKRVDRLFRESGLMREKWDEVHFADGSTYGEKTVERAIAGTSEFYDPGSVAEEDAVDTEEIPTDSPETSSDSTADSLERIEALHGTIENLNSRIQTLESENTQLRDELNQERARRKELQARLDSDDPDSDSMWARFWSTITSE